MPALVPTDFVGRVTWLGLNDDRAVGLGNRAVETLDLRFQGPVGESRNGLTRASCSRVVSQYPKGSEIKNTRQLCLMSAEELAEIGAGMSVEALAPALLSVSVLLEGIPDFTHIPPGSRLVSQAGAAICVDMENRPCHLPAKGIEAVMPGKGGLFKAAAKGRRGVTGWVEREGLLRVGDALRLHVPEQRAWVQ
ncbi:MAG: sulfurase [Rhodobacteraceae bacterium]|nr:sulfurase [Paracoccaceae bacterium]